MKMISTMLVSILFCSVIGAGQERPAPPARDPHLTSEERAKAVKLLADSQKEFLDALENVNEAQWNWRPSIFKWSVGQVAEHIVLAESGIFSVVQQALAQKPNPDWESKTGGKAELIERVLPNRTGRAQSPNQLRPSGKLTRDDVIRRFKEGRAKILEFAQKTDLPLKAHTFDNPFPIFSTLNAYDWLMYIPLHTMRHDKQIAEVKGTAGYPK